MNHFICFLFDNGSLRPAATLAQRQVARALQAKVGVPVRAVSLLHSDRVDPAELNGEGADMLESSLGEFADHGGKRALLLPMFMGPSGAMSHYLPSRLKLIGARHPRLEITLAPCLIGPEDDSADLVATLLHRRCEQVRRRESLHDPAIIVTDHGSPLAAVTAVRDAVGKKLADQWPAGRERVAVASMERRPGPAYDFNEPLLHRAISSLIERGIENLVVAQLFLHPGRHAGPAGDVARICQAAIRQHPAVRIVPTDPIGKSREILELLARRFFESV